MATRPIVDSAAARVLHIGGWLAAGPLAFVALARILAWESRTTLIALNAFTPLLLLPAWPLAVLSAVLRRWVLLGASGLLVAAHVAVAAPELAAADAVPPEARSAPAFRLYNANVFVENRDVQGYAVEIRRHRPDLVVLQEATPAFLAALEATGALDGLPHRMTVARDDPFAAAVASRWPLEQRDVLTGHGRPIVLGATIEIHGRPIRLLAVHAVAPAGEGRPEWGEDLDAVRQAAAAERLPVLLAGDFNATWGHRPFRRLLDAGLTDAAAARGRAYQMTWPRNRRLVPPAARIDHVLTSQHLAVTRLWAGEGRGSDHRPLVADVAVLATD